jgi:hypothetical protein
MNEAEENGWTEDEVIQKAVEAYMMEEWERLRELAAMLEPAGRNRLADALYVP